MVEFLKFINAEGKYYVARDLDLDGPFQEILGILNREKDEEEYERVKNTLFAAMMLAKKGDLTRYIREDVGRDIIKTDKREEFLEEYEDIVEDVYDAYHDEEEVTMNTVKVVNEKLTDVREDATQIVQNFKHETQLTRVKMKPIDSLNSALKILKDVEIDQLARMDVKTKEKFSKLVDQIREELEAYESRI